MATVIDQHTPHRLCRQRQALRPPRQCGTAVLLQSKPSLVHERRGLQRVIRSLASEIPARDAAQLVVQQRKELLNREFRRGHVSSLTLQASELPTCVYERL